MEVDNNIEESVTPVDNTEEVSLRSIMDNFQLDESDLEPVPVDTKETLHPSLVDFQLDEADLPPIKTPQEINKEALGGQPLDTLPVEAKAEIENEADQWTQIGKAFFSEDELKAMTDKGPIGIWDQMGFLDFEDTIPMGGFRQAAESAVLLKAADNFKNKQPLNAQQQKLMKQFISERVEIANRSMTLGGSIAHGLMQTPAFMVEMFATGGVGALAKVGLKKKAKTALTKEISKTVLKTSANPAMLGRLAGTVGERRVNQSIQITDKGELLMNEAVESPAKTALMAFGHHTIQVGSELSGPAIDKAASFVVKPVTKFTGPLLNETVKPVLKSAFMGGLKKVPVDTRRAIVTAYKKVKPGATVGEIFTKSGWTSVLSELGEERVSQILSGTLDLVATDEVDMGNYLDVITPSKDDVLIEAGVVGILRGSSASYNITKGLLGGSQESIDAVNNMTVAEQEAMIEESMAPRHDPELEALMKGALTVVDSSSRELSLEGPNVDYTESSWSLIHRDLKEAGDTIYAQVFNDVHALEKLSAESVKAGNVQPSALNLANTVRRLRANGMLVQSNLMTGTTRTNAETGQVERTGAGYREVLNSWDGNTLDIEPNRKARAQDFNDYRIALSVSDDVSLDKDKRIDLDVQLKEGRNSALKLVNVSGTSTKRDSNRLSSINSAYKTLSEASKDGRLFESTHKDVNNALKRLGMKRPKDPGYITSPEAQANAEATIERLEAKYEGAYTHISENAKESTEFLQRVFINLVDAGVVSQEFYDAKVAERPNFATLRRVMEAEVHSATGMTLDQFSDIKNTGPVLKKRRGSDREVEDMNLNIMTYVSDVIKLTETAKVGQQMAQVAEYLPDRVKKVTGTPGPFTARKQTPYWENGKLKWLEIDKPLQEAMKNLDRFVPANVVTKTLDAFFKGTAGLLRTGATATPEFAIRNFLRDAHSATIHSKGKINPLNILDGVAAQVYDPALVEQFHRDGGGFHSVTQALGSDLTKSTKGSLLDSVASYRIPGVSEVAAKAAAKKHANKTEKAYKEILGAQNPKEKALEFAKYAFPLTAMNKINETLEMAPRLAIYKKLRKDGMDGIEAALQARDITLDFQRGGSAGRFLNRYIPFFNASLQGIDKTFRVFRDDPATASFWAAATITVPQVLLTGYFLYGADEETRQHYLEMNDYQRDLAWPVGFTDTGRPIMYPKPFTTGYLFGSLVERMMIESFSNNEDAEIKQFWKSTLGGIVGATSPITDPAAVFPVPLKLFAELTSNHSFFFDSSIVQDHQEGLTGVQARDRKGRRTSQTSQEIGDFFNVSPAKLDYTVSSLLGGSGKDYLLPATDKLLRSYKKLRGEDIVEPLRTVDDIPVVRAFTDPAPTGSRSRSLSNFYTNLEEANQAAGSLDEREGNRDEFRDFSRRFKGELEGRKDLNKAYKKLREMNKDINEVKDSKRLSNEAKLNKLVKMDAEVTKLTRKANEQYKNIKEKYKER